MERYGIVIISPSISSPSSSDLDTESTLSFFEERSTSLGALMGVSVAPVRREREKRKQRSCWWCCIGDEEEQKVVASSSCYTLGHLLEAERRQGFLVPPANGGENLLFEDGRVLPPRHHLPPPSVTRLPVCFNGICRRRS
ncbi:uncharacterized protein At3g17950 [Amborella trichopoda]|uniref:Uncharacterized protein n=1 Tax=Amborella trichopoda TaxID=13333 RepID=W1NFE1_AMBTC|nr:uncharacterized protein At3g17950 [Amborella trichopoda]ERM94158.1 hypothetical protein AMTR_s00010p00170270 [Amborella trichopoda]|eukprot:XP_006826921.1 uncharacterized protein At3g17950 [Amborella trichopoda]